ncbi:MAG: hypothetical protein M1334_04290 [Patescibacteria group bacterium]|nr:hypothetical protein [Patescibacteria group bacterium]
MDVKKIIFIVFLVGFLVIANFSFAASASFSQGSIESLQSAYYSALQRLVVLLQEQVAALTQQLKSASSSAVISGLSTSSQSTSTPTPSANNYSGSLFDYYPTWHLAPGSCVPQLY